MTQVFLDAALRSKLPDLRQPLDLCDETGKVVAHIIPALDPADYEPAEPPPLSEEELQRRLAGTRWYTTAEVLKHLESL